MGLKRTGAVLAFAALLLLAASSAQAVYRGHKLCDPQIGDYDASLSADRALAAMKAKVDESWRQLAAFGDPDRRAAARDRRLDWLCEVKAACGSDLAAGERCILERIGDRERVNVALIEAHKR